MAQVNTSQRKTGFVKWFNVLKGYGFITPFDGSADVFVHQSVIRMSGFRSLDDNEVVEFASYRSDKGWEATFVCGPSGASPRGSHRRPRARRRQMESPIESQPVSAPTTPLIRCYNCGDYGNHMAAQCPRGPLPKCCYFCRGCDHLVGNCPSRIYSRANREWSEVENSFLMSPPSSVPAFNRSQQLRRDSEQPGCSRFQETSQRPSMLRK